MVSFQRMSALRSMIATYNHELTNPLTVCFGFLRMLAKNTEKETYPEIEKLTTNLNRISDVVKKIRDLERDETTKYCNETHMMKIHGYKTSDDDAA